MIEYCHTDFTQWEMLTSDQGELIAILDSVDDAAYIINQQYEVEYINSEVLAAFGPVEGRKCYQYFSNLENICPWCKHNIVIIEGKTYHREWFSAKDKRVYDLIATPLKAMDGEIVKLGICRDITKRKKEEEELKRYRSHLERLLDCDQYGLSAFQGYPCQPVES